MFDTPHRLHPAAIIIKFGTYFVATIRSLVVPLAGIFFSERHASAQFVPLVVGLSVAVIGGLSIAGTIVHYLSTTFFVKDEALEISSGFIWRKNRTIPLARIQNVNIERTLWHRVLGAAAVKVETATGKKGEGDLTALSISDANSLQAVLLHRRSDDVVIEEVKKPEALYQLSTRQVLLAGALGNRAVYIIASIFAVFQFEGLRGFFSKLADYLQSLGPAMAAIIVGVSFIGVIVIGWLVSVGVSATRFFGFRIEQHDRGLLLTHGLITQFKTIVPVGRIQNVRVVEPPLYRALGYCEIYADTAGSFDAKDAASANKVCPILPERDASRIGKLLLSEFEFEKLSWSRVSNKTIGRHASRVFFALLILFSLPLGFWLHWKCLWAIPPLAVYSWITGLVSYRYVGYAWTNDIIASRRGVFSKQAVVIPFDRIQHYSINSSFIQRLLGLASVTAVSASTSGHGIHIIDMEASSARTLGETLGVAIERHLGSRRGGL